MAFPVLLLIYGNLCKVNCTFPLYLRECVLELCLSWLRGCLDWGFCLIVSASRSMTFKSGGGKYCRESKGSVEDDCSDLRQLWVGAGKAAKRAGLGAASSLRTKKNLLCGINEWQYAIPSL